MRPFARIQTELTMKSVRLLAAVALVAGLGGCAKSVGDISRVQPDFYPKGWFTGTWYARATVIGTQYNQANLFEGLEGEMEKIRWEVQETQLIGWRAYEAIPNSEEQVGTNAPVAIFNILSHFDLRRDYNPNTGVETNVIVENTMDRPWWEREYMRIEWVNRVPDYSLAGFMNAAGTPMPINQTGDKYEVERPRISATYIDVVTRVHMDVDFSMYYMYGFEGDLLKSSQTDVRWSFRKVEDTGYEPLLYPDYLSVKVKYRYARRLAAGVFEPCEPSRDDRTCSLYGGAPSSGPEGQCASASATATPNWNGTALCHPETTLEQDCFCTSAPQDLYVNSSGSICDSRLRGEDIDPEDCSQITYPIFERFGFFRTLRLPFDWERGFTQNGRIYLANRWHIWQRSKDENGMVIPHAQRTPKPVTYYLNPEFPEDLVDVAEDIGNQWSTPLKETVAELQGRNMAEVPEMFVVKRNSCSISNVKQFAQSKGLEWVLENAVGGVERVEAGNLKRACTALEVETAASEDANDRFEWQRIGDLRYAFMHWVHTPQQAGPLGFGPSSADPETGEIVSANAYLYGAGVDTYANFAADVVQLVNGEMSPSEFASGETVVNEISMGRAKVNEGLSKRTARQVMQRVADMDHGQADYMPQLSKPSDLNRMDPRSALALQDQNLRLSTMEQFAAENLVDDNMLRAFAGPNRYQPGQTPSADALKRANPARWGKWPDATRQMQAFNPAEESPDAEPTMGVVDRYARMERFLAEHNIEYGSMLVEPAIYGLAQTLKNKPRDEVVRHARREIFRAVEAHEVGHTLGLRHNFAGSSDALNFIKDFWTQPDPNLEPTSRKWDYGYSSIMDYHQRFSSDWAGIGPYDRAAVKFGYGQLMEVFDEREGKFFPQGYFDFATSVMDYSDLPRILSSTDVDDKFESAYYDAIAGRSQVLTLPADVRPNVENMYKRRNVPFAEVWKDYMLDQLPGYVNGEYRPDYENQLNMVPYQFCSDMYAWGGNLTCNRYDMGANIQEIVQNASDMYKAYYLFNNFRRDRFFFGGGPMQFDVNSYLQRTYDRTFQPMLNSFRYFYYYRRSQLIMYPLVQDWATAALNGLNFFGQVLQTPQPGRHCLTTEGYVYHREVPGDCDNPIEVPLGEGRYFGTEWTREYYYKPTQIGSYWDKWLSIYALTNSQFFLVRNFSSLFDRGAFSITYYRVFEDEITELFRSMTEGNLGQFMGGVQQDQETGQYVLVPRPLVGGEGQSAPSTPRIKANINWSLQKMAGLYSMVGFTSSVDRKMDFARRNRITYLGGNDDPLYAGFLPNQIATFTDPVTHLTYRAAPVPSPDTPNSGLNAPGYKLVEATRLFYENSWMPAETMFNTAQANLDTVIANANSTAQEINDATEARDLAQVNFNATDRTLREKVELLEYVRVLGQYLHLYND